MATIASLGINLAISTAAFTKGLANAKGSLSSFTSSLTSAKGVLAGLGATVAGAFSVAVFKGWVDEGLGAVDNLNDLAQKLSVTVPAMQELGYAAALSGTDMEGLSGAMSKMVVNLGKAENGSGLGKTLNKLGLDVRQLKQLSPDEQFKQIIGGLNGITNPAEQAAAAVAIFGKKGQDLTQLIKGGAEGLAEMSAEFQAFGLSISDVDAQKVAAANDALDKVGMMVTGLKNKLAVELAPYITAATNAFLEWAKAGGGVGTKIGTAVEYVAKGLAYAADFLDVFKIGWKGLQVAVTTVIGSIVKQVTLMAQAIDGVAAFAGLETNLSGTLTAISADLDKLIGSQVKDFNDALLAPSSSAKVENFFNGIKQQAQEAATAAAESAKTVQSSVIQGADMDLLGLAEKLKPLAKKQADDKKKMEDAAKRSFEETRTPMEKFETKIKELKTLFEKGAFDKLGGADTFNRSIKEAEKELTDSIKKPEDAKKQENKLSEAQLYGSAAARSTILAGRGAKPNEKVQVDQLTELKKIAIASAKAAEAKLSIKVVDKI